MFLSVRIHSRKIIFLTKTGNDRLIRLHVNMMFIFKDFLCHGIIRQASNLLMISFYNFFLCLTRPCSLSKLVIYISYQFAVINFFSSHYWYINQWNNHDVRSGSYFACNVYRPQHSNIPIMGNSRMYNYSKFHGISVKSEKFSHSRDFLQTPFWPFPGF